MSIESRDTASFGMGLPPASFLNRPRNLALTALNRRLLRRPNQILDDLHTAVPGIPMPGTFADWGRRADALVQFTVPSFEYPLSDAPAELHFVGPLSATGSQAPLPERWSDLDGTRSVIHVTQGTVANTDYGQVIAPTLRALADDDVLVVVTTGGRPLDTLPPLPANVRAATYLPYDELLPRISVYVTNGGNSGVHYALRYGVPIVATGGKEDKPEVGARIAWSGVGRRIRSEHPSPKALPGTCSPCCISPATAGPADAWQPTLPRLPVWPLGRRRRSVGSGIQSVADCRAVPTAVVTHCLHGLGFQHGTGVPEKARLGQAIL